MVVQECSGMLKISKMWTAGSHLRLSQTTKSWPCPTTARCDQSVWESVVNPSMKIYGRSNDQHINT